MKYNATRLVWRGEVENEKNLVIEADDTGDALMKVLEELEREELVGDSLSIHISRKEEKGERSTTKN